MSKIRKDGHGLYARFGGYLFRPAHNYHTQHGYAHVLSFDQPSKIMEGDDAKCYHRGGTQLGTVRVGDVKETWVSHGAWQEWDEDCNKLLTTASEDLWDVVAPAWATEMPLKEFCEMAGDANIRITT